MTPDDKRRTNNLAGSAVFCFIAEGPDRLQPFLRALWPAAGVTLWTADPNEALRLTAAGRQGLSTSPIGLSLNFRKVLSR